MILVYICLISLFFIILNLNLTNNDYFNPAVIFPFLFLVQAIFNLFALTYLDLEFHVEILVILSVSYLLFTIFNFVNLTRGTLKSGIVVKNLDTPLRIPQFLYYFAILSFILVIYFYYHRLGQVALATGLGGASLSEKISTYDSLTKFNPKYFSKLNINIPAIITNLAIITQVFGYLISYKLVQNFVVEKKVQVLDVGIIVLLIGQMYLGGSRSPIFRLLTFIIFIFYILSLKSGYSRAQMRKVMSKIIRIILGVVVLFVFSLSLYGRVVEYNAFHYLYIYLGAPLYNLDLFIQKFQFPIKQEYFGGQTFISFWNYWLPRHDLDTIRLYLPFIRYSSEYELGNVYTTFYQFLYDFGYSGLFGLTTIIALYYTTSYRQVRVKINRSVLPINLFIYAYLFNDLIMLLFSNRFYETVLNVNTIKIFIAAYIVKSLLFDDGFYFGKYKIRLR